MIEQMIANEIIERLTIEDGRFRMQLFEPVKGIVYGNINIKEGYWIDYFFIPEPDTIYIEVDMETEAKVNIKKLNTILQNYYA